MSQIRRIRTRTALVATGVAGVVVTSGAMWAYAETSPQTINGCVNTSTGALRVLGSGGSCRQGETALSWNQVGPAGPQGTPGFAGPTGAAGAAGPQGPAGTPGRDAPNPTPNGRVVGELAITGTKQGPIGGGADATVLKTAIYGISYGASEPVDPVTGLPTGKRSFDSIQVVRRIDAATPSLFTALSNNEGLSTVEIDVLSANSTATGPVVVQQIKLTNALIESDKVSDGGAEGTSTIETLTLHYQKIEIDAVNGGQVTSRFAQDLTGA